MANKNEKFVSECLTNYLESKYKNVSYRPSEIDPPDTVINIDGAEIAVEITEININTLANRSTIDKGYLDYIYNLDNLLGNDVANNQRVMIHFYHNYIKVSQISKKFKAYLSIFLASDGVVSENEINGVKFRIEKLYVSKNGARRIIGSVTPYGGKITTSRDIKLVEKQICEANLSLQTSMMISERITTKSKKCQNLDSEHIWLALHDKYYDKFTNFEDENHVTHYVDIMKCIEDFGVFKKIFVVFENKSVLEFSLDKS